MRVLVAYHTRTGDTKKAAGAIAQALRAVPYEVDLEEIREAGSGGAVGLLGAARKSLFGSKAKIEPVRADLSAYDLVIVGTPIRAWTATAAAKAFLAAHAEDIRQAAFFCTRKGPGAQRAFEAMEEAADKTALATAAFKRKYVRKGDEFEFLGRVDEFVGEIIRAIGRGGVRSEPRRAQAAREANVITFETSAAFLQRFDSFRGGVLRSVDFSYPAGRHGGPVRPAWSARVVVSARDAPPQGEGEAGAGAVDVALTIEDVKELRVTEEPEAGTPDRVLRSGMRIGFLGDFTYLDLCPRSDSAETLSDFMQSGLLIAGSRCTWEARPAGE